MNCAAWHNHQLEDHHSMETIQSAPQRPDDSRCKAITRLIDAVAEQQEALARILEAEHEKNRKGNSVVRCRYR